MSIHKLASTWEHACQLLRPNPLTKSGHAPSHEASSRTALPRIPAKGLLRMMGKGGGTVWSAPMCFMVYHSSTYTLPQCDTCANPGHTRSELAWMDAVTNAQVALSGSCVGQLSNGKSDL